MSKTTAVIPTAIAVCLLVTLPCTNAAAADHALPPGPYVSTSGEARIEQMPDYALILIGLTGEGTTAGEARDALDAGGKELNALVDRFANAVGERRLRTISVTPVYQRTEQHERQLTGFQAEQSVTLRVDDLTRLNALYYDLAALNADGLGTPSYHVEDESTLHDRVRSLALENARRNAEVLANSQGARLGPIWGVVLRPQHAFADQFSTGVQREYDHSINVAGIGGYQLSIPLEPEPVPYTASVGVVYRMEPGTVSQP